MSIYQLAKGRLNVVILAVIAGQGTLGLEILEQVPNCDAILVPIGGAGLIAGVALAVKTLQPKVKIIGVETERCASFDAALQKGAPVQVEAGRLYAAASLDQALDTMAAAASAQR